MPADPTRPAPTSCDAFMPSSPEVYGAKVKTLLTGLALTEDELTTLQGDPAALEGLVEEWLALPEAEPKLFRFFATAFQQEGFDTEGLTIQWGEDRDRMGDVRGTNHRLFDVLRKNFEESFARTALQHVREGRPFQELFTIDSYYMTTAMMVAMAYADDVNVDDAGDPRYGVLARRIPEVSFTRSSVPLTRTFDPGSPDFMRFTIDDADAVPGCSGGTITDGTRNAPRTAFRATMGFFSRIGPRSCRGSKNVRADGALEPSDFEDWRLVKVRPPASGERVMQFYELDRLRGATELLARTPRVGFFTTPAFFAAWQTNEDNQARVTANQTLIVAYGKSIDASDTTFAIFDDALDGEHADPTTACWGCHRSLDPMRQFFRMDYTYGYGRQADPEIRALRPAFAFGGIEETGETIQDFAQILGSHHWLPEAWAQKLCFYANSAPCPEGAELDRIAAAFRDSGMDFRVLIRELFSSPLVTNAECIEGSTGDNAGISRARHFCDALSNRLETPDICGIAAVTRADRTRLGTRNAAVIGTIPDDAFSRGDENPVTVSDVNLFVRGTFERVCDNVAAEMAGAGKRFDPSAADAAIPRLVEELMGLPPSDSRHDGALAILQEHHAAALAEGATPAIALQSTFSLACMSPSLTGVGL